MLLIRWRVDWILGLVTNANLSRLERYEIIKVLK